MTPMTAVLPVFKIRNAPWRLRLGFANCSLRIPRVRDRTLPLGTTEKEQVPRRRWDRILRTCCQAVAGDTD